LLPNILFEKSHIYILALRMASPGNRHCANCIDTLSFPIAAAALCCGAVAAVRLAPATVDRYFLPAGRPAANPPHATAALD